MSRGLKWMMGGVAAVFLTFLLLIVISDKGLVELSRLNGQHRAITMQNEALALENYKLRRTIDRLDHDLAYIENEARTELGMVGKDDLIIILPRGALKN